MATLDLNNQLVCQNPPSGRTSKFKFVPPEIPEKLANFTLVKSDHREYTAGQCEVQNGTLVNTRDYHVSEDGSLVHVGKLVFCLTANQELPKTLLDFRFQFLARFLCWLY